MICEIANLVFSERG